MAPLAMTNHKQEEWTSSMKGGPKRLTSWAISEIYRSCHMENLSRRL